MYIKLNSHKIENKPGERCERTVWSRMTIALLALDPLGFGTSTEKCDSFHESQKKTFARWWSTYAAQTDPVGSGQASEES